MRTVPRSSPRQGKSKAALLPANSLGREGFGSRNQPPMRELVLLHVRPQSIWQAHRADSAEELANHQISAHNNQPRGEKQQAVGAAARTNVPNNQASTANMATMGATNRGGGGHP